MMMTPSVPLARRRGRVPMPSIWPLIHRVSARASSTAKTSNLTLEEPALTTRTVSMRSELLLEHELFRKPVPTFRDHALCARQRGDAAARVGVEHGDRA